MKYVNITGHHAHHWAFAIFLITLPLACIALLMLVGGWFGRSRMSTRTFRLNQVSSLRHRPLTPVCQVLHEQPCSSLSSTLKRCICSHGRLLSAAAGLALWKAASFIFVLLAGLDLSGAYWRALDWTPARSRREHEPGNEQYLFNRQRLTYREALRWIIRSPA